MAGQTPSRPLGRREAAVVMTGAPIPPGCDAVVMHERTADAMDRRARLRAGGHGRAKHAGARPGDACRRGRGRERIDPSTGARWGSWPRSAAPRSRVVPRPQVAIVPTGDELVEPGQTPGPGQIRNSNAVMLERSGDQAGGRRRGAADRARRAGAAAARFSSAGSMRIFWSSPAASRPASATWFRRPSRPLGSVASFTRFASSRASRSGSESGRRGAIARRHSSSGCRAIR